MHRVVRVPTESDATRVDRIPQYVEHRDVTPGSAGTSAMAALVEPVGQRPRAQLLLYIQAEDQLEHRLLGGIHLQETRLGPQSIADGNRTAEGLASGRPTLPS